MESIAKEDIKPYLSLLLATKDGCAKNNIHDTIVKLIKENSPEKNQLVLSSTEHDELGVIGSVALTGYRISKEPSWTSNKEFVDIEHHVFISFAVGNYYAFYFSENGKKDEIRELFGSRKLPNIKVVKINQLNFNFINEDEIRMLWLSGIHGKNNFKAESKVLGGEGVADALDPLLDQSYMMSAVRTQIEGEKSTYGINTFKSSIWRGPCSSWQAFENRVIEILDKLNAHPEESECPISILSYPIPDCDDLEEPYDFSLVDHEFLQEQDGQVRSDLLKRLQYDYTAEIIAPLNTAKSKINLKIFYEEKEVGEVELQPVISKYKVDFEILDSKHKKSFKSVFDQYIRVFKYPELIKCWYESGHALVNGRVFKTGYRDVDYSKFGWTYFENIDLTKEKPGADKKKPDLSKIGKDDSLFCWMQKNWNGQWLEPIEFEFKEKSTGWLFCDDGAGEKADFIHIENYKRQNIISLIHIKAAKSNSVSREISVGVHDIVLNQAIKNIRYCTRKALYEALSERWQNSKSKYCWKDGIEDNAENFLNHLETLSNNRDTKYRVIVIQPHTQKSVYENFQGKKIRNQLDVLLTSAENAIHSTGADFHIFGVYD